MVAVLSSCFLDRCRGIVYLLAVALALQSCPFLGVPVFVPSRQHEETEDSEQEGPRGFSWGPTLACRHHLRRTNLHADPVHTLAASAPRLHIQQMGLARDCCQPKPLVVPLRC